MSKSSWKAVPIWMREHWIHAHQSVSKTKSTKNSQREITRKELTRFGNLLIRKSMYNELLIVFMDTQSLLNSIKGVNNFDLSHLIIDNNFDHMGISDTGRHWPYVPDLRWESTVIRCHSIMEI